MEHLFEIALRGTDVKTTASFAEHDLWCAKFNTEFNASWYQSHWTAKENYKLQKRGGVMNLAIAGPWTSTVDCALYTPCVRHTRLLVLPPVPDFPNTMSSFQIAELDFRQPVHK